MLTGIVDLDADSIRLSVYHYENEELRLILSETTPLGLSCYVEAGILSSKGIKKTCSALQYFCELLHCLGVQFAYGYAAASLSELVNLAEFLQQIQDGTGLAIEPLSWETAAALGYVGASQSAEWDSGLYVDIGGGGTQLAVLENGWIVRAAGLPLGSLTLSLLYVKSITPHKSNILDMKQELKRRLKKTGLFEQGWQCGLCASGSTAAAALELYNDIYDMNDVNTRMETEKFMSLLTRYNDERRDFTKRIKQLVPDRIHTIIPGIVILNTIVSMSGSDSIEVSSAGVREGYFLERVLKRDQTSKTADALQ